MWLHEFTYFFSMIQHVVFLFWAQWAAMAARRFLFGAVSGDGHVSRTDASEVKSMLEINYNPRLRDLHRILFYLAFGVTPKFSTSAKQADKTSAVPEYVYKKWTLVVGKRNDPLPLPAIAAGPALPENLCLR